MTGLRWGELRAAAHWLTETRLRNLSSSARTPRSTPRRIQSRGAAPARAVVRKVPLGFHRHALRHLAASACCDEAHRYMTSLNTSRRSPDGPRCLRVCSLRRPAPRPCAAARGSRRVIREVVGSLGGHLGATRTVRRQGINRRVVGSVLEELELTGDFLRRRRDLNSGSVIPVSIHLNPSGPDSAVTGVWSPTRSPWIPLRACSIPLGRGHALTAGSFPGDESALLDCRAETRRGCDATDH